MAALRTEQTSGWGLTFLSCRKHRSLLVSGMVKGSRLLLNYGARGHEQLCTDSSFCCYFILFELMFPHLHIGPCLLTLTENFYPHNKDCLQSYTHAQMFMHTVHMYHKQKNSEPQERNCFSLRESCINHFFFSFLASKCNENVGSVQHNSLILGPNVLSTVRTSSPLYKNES